MSREFNREAERKKVLADSIAIKQINQLGLFQYTPFSVGDDSLFQKKAPKRDPDNPLKVVTKPRQCLPGVGKSGKEPTTYFSYNFREKYVDTYVESFNVQKILAAKNSKNVKKLKHDAPFRQPGGLYKHPNVSYPHMQDYDTKRILPKRDDNGKVLIHSRHIQTNPPKRGHFNTTVGHFFNGQVEHMKEPYGAERIIELKKKRERSKLCTHDQAFKRMDTGMNPFMNNVQQYNFNLTKYPEKKVKSYRSDIKHDGAFKRGMQMKWGPYATIAKIPEYKGNPLKVLKKSTTTGERKEPFRQGYAKIKWKPCPSIANKPRNLMRLTMNSFRRK